MRQLALRNWIWLILGVGILLRIYWAVQILDGVHPDEHYQTLEPAGRLVYGYGWLSWEWQPEHAMRTWLNPAFFAPTLWILKAFGVNGGATTIIACQVQVALLCGVSLLAFSRWLSMIGIQEIARMIALTWFALSPLMIAWSSATTTDVMAMAVFWIAMPIAWKRPGSILSGALLGLAVIVRIQMAALVVPVLLGLAWFLPSQERIRGIVRAACGLGLGLVPLAVIDWITWGAPFASVANNIQRNLIQGTASFYGVSPWYDYLPRLMVNAGEKEGVLIFLTALAMLAGAIGRSDLRKLLPVLVGGALYLVLHMTIPHKETRFIVPLYPLLFLGFAYAVQFLSIRVRPFALWVGVSVVLAFGLAPWRTQAILTPGHFSNSSISDLMLEVREKGGVSAGGCVLFVDHYWVWAQGELLQGKPTRYVEESASKLTDASLNQCQFAIVSPGAFTRSRFEEKSGPLGWKQIKTNHWGHLLYQHQE